MSEAAVLSEPQKRAIFARRTDIQLIACAGSGKTETIACRAAALVSEGVSPECIIAFTFTDRAAAELKDRILRRIADLVGMDTARTLRPVFVGTIHGWCFRTLQEKVPKFSDFEVIDEHRHAAFLSREASVLNLKELAGNRHWDGARLWMRISDIVGNELLGESELEAAGLLERWRTYIDLLDRFRYLTFSRVVAETVRALKDLDTGPRIRDALKHLIVDEYQDVNPAQERLIELLTLDGAELCAVGDDDQAIYPWRGADVSNIVELAVRRPGILRIELAENRRSRPSIVRTASTFAGSIEGRLPKVMRPVRDARGPSVFTFEVETDEEEACRIADAVQHLHKIGWAYGDIAVLLRSVKGSGGPFFDAFRDRSIPFEAGGRSGLFSTPALDALGEVYAYLTGVSWRSGAYGPSTDPDLESASERIVNALRAQNVQPPEKLDVAAYVRDWKSFYTKLNTKVPDFVAEYYKFLDFLGISQTGLEGQSLGPLSGSLSRFSNILADYEHAARRGRFHDEEKGPVYRAGKDRGKSYWFGLGTYIAHYAAGAYEEAAAEEPKDGQAVRILTVHQSKGLEWPIVFLPCLVDGRFPSGRTGEESDWPFPESVLPMETRRRYEGRESDERRLFYVAMTRAREILCCSTFERKKRTFRPSPFLREILGMSEGSDVRDFPPCPGTTAGPQNGESLELAFSDAALWEDCGLKFRYSKVQGFEQSLAEELGYGHAVHGALRQVAERTRDLGRVPTEDEAAAIALGSFYAPYADEGSRSRMLTSVERMVRAYVREHSEDLTRAWALEHPFELRLESGTVTGRADLIVDRGPAGRESLALVDYKIAEDPERENRYEWQLRVYALAGRREGRNVEAAYLHALGDGTRRPVSLNPSDLAEAETRVVRALQAVRAGEFPPRPGPARCGTCDFKSLCRHRDRSLE